MSAHVLKLYTRKFACELFGLPVQFNASWRLDFPQAVHLTHDEQTIASDDHVSKPLLLANLKRLDHRGILGKVVGIDAQGAAVFLVDCFKPRAPR